MGPFIVPVKRAIEQVQSPCAKKTRYGLLTRSAHDHVFRVSPLERLEILAVPRVVAHQPPAH